VLNVGEIWEFGQHERRLRRLKEHGIGEIPQKSINLFFVRVFEISFKNLYTY
jgi:hypothetical protein